MFPPTAPGSTPGGDPTLGGATADDGSLYCDLSFDGEPSRLELVKLTIGRGMSDDGIATDGVTDDGKTFDKSVEATLGDVSIDTIGRDTDMYVTLLSVTAPVAAACVLRR